MAQEIWKPIKGYEGLYEVSNLGNVRNSKTKKIKIVQLTNNNYSQVLLWIKHKAKAFNIHRLVAQAFIENSKNCEDVNHIDGNKQNNKVENLEWCTRSENIKHAYDNQLRNKKIGKMHIKSKLIQCVETNKLYWGAGEAQRDMEIWANSITDCCLGKRKSAGGFHWRYIDER